MSYPGRTYAEGKKISWKDGLSAVRCILKYNLLRSLPVDKVLHALPAMKRVST